jgi:undecaprenyl-diphosphatase
VTYLIAALLGIIQGLTEFLPVSSTAHLILGGQFLGYEDPVFTVMIQLGAVLAVMWLYRAKIVAVLVGLRSDPDARRFAAMIVVGTIPAVIAGGLLADYVQEVLYYNPPVIGASFIVGGVVMLLVERYRPAPVVLDAERTSLGRALGIGAWQALAIVPGVSRSGATIVGAMMMGLDRAAAAEFSFFLAMPTMIGAFTFELVDVRNQIDPGRAVEIAIGFVMAFVAARLVVRPFLRFVARSGFAPFAWYRIVAGAGIFAAMWAGLLGAE